MQAGRGYAPNSSNNSLGRVYSADEYYSKTLNNNPFRGSVDMLNSPMYAEQYTENDYASSSRPKRISSDPDEKDRLPIGDAVGPLMVMLLIYTGWIYRRRRKEG